MSKPLLVLIPGVLNTDELWRHQIAAFGAEYQIIVPETHCHTSMGDIAEAILSSITGPFSLAGLSMGGYIALEMMRRASNRVERLALINTSARADTEESIKRREAFIRLAQLGKFKGVTPRLLPTLIHEKSRENPEIADCIYRMSNDIGAEGFVNQQRAVIGREDSLPTLRMIKQETLIIVGRQDGVTPPALSTEMSRHIKRSEVHVLNDCGHLAPLEQAQKTTDLMGAWLGKDCTMAQSA